MYIYLCSFCIIKLKLRHMTVKWRSSLLTYSKDAEVNRFSLIVSCQSETSFTIPSLDVDGYAGISVPWKTSKEVTLKSKSLITSRFYVMLTSCMHTQPYLLVDIMVCNVLIMHGILFQEELIDLNIKDFILMLCYNIKLTEVHMI